MDSLQFIQTVSVDDFKKEMGVKSLVVKRNPHTGKCFFAYGVKVGAVSEKFERGELSDPVVSQVCTPDTGEIFYLLHQNGEGGCPTLAEF